MGKAPRQKSAKRISPDSTFAETRRKLEEARLGVALLDPRDRPFVVDPSLRLHFNNFLAAARSVHNYLAAEAGISGKEYDRWLSRWVGARSQADGELHETFCARRDAEIHALERPEVTVGLALKPIPGHVVSRNSWLWGGEPLEPPQQQYPACFVHRSDGEKVEAAGECGRYVAFLDELVPAFIRDYVRAL